MAQTLTPIERARRAQELVAMIENLPITHPRVGNDSTAQGLRWMELAKELAELGYMPEGAPVADGNRYSVPGTIPLDDPRLQAPPVTAGPFSVDDGSFVGRPPLAPLPTLRSGDMNPVLKRIREDYGIAQALGDEEAMAAAAAAEAELLAGSPQATTFLEPPAILDRPTERGFDVDTPARDPAPLRPRAPARPMPDLDIDPLGTGMAGIGDPPLPPVVEDYTQLLDPDPEPTPNLPAGSSVRRDSRNAVADADPEEPEVKDTPPVEAAEGPPGDPWGHSKDLVPDSIDVLADKSDGNTNPIPVTGFTGPYMNPTPTRGLSTDDDIEDLMPPPAKDGGGGAAAAPTPAATPRPTPRPSGAVPVDRTAEIAAMANTIAAKAKEPPSQTRIQWDDEGNVVVHDPRLGKNRPEMRRPHVEVFLDHRMPAKPAAPVQTVVPTQRLVAAAAPAGLQRDRNVFKLFGKGGLFGGR